MPLPEGDNQTQNNQSGGRVSQVTQTAFSEIFKRFTQTATKSLLTNPTTWIVMGIIALFLVVFVIVISGAAPGAPPQDVVTPTPAP